MSLTSYALAIVHIIMLLNMYFCIVCVYSYKVMYVYSYTTCIMYVYSYKVVQLQSSLLAF